MQSQHFLWHKSVNGIGDRIHLIVQMMELAEKLNARFVIDFRDGMFGELGENAFDRWLECSHPLWQPEPDLDKVLHAFEGNHTPPRVADFHVHQWRHMPYMYRSTSAAVARRLGISPKYNSMLARLLRKLNIIFPSRWMIYRETGERAFPQARSIDVQQKTAPTLMLCMDVVRTPHWSNERMVWPREHAIESIESTWLDMGLDPGHCAAIHVRQTDKSTSTVWKKWISEIKDGERFDHCTQLFIATDSKRVLEAFQQAGLKQSILHNPWLDLTDSEAALHKSDMRGEQIMRTALYDMWTASKCQAFLPWRFSSFSRVITAWRRFERPQQSR
jgi:hypothetical protein